MPVSWPAAGEGEARAEDEAASVRAARAHLAAEDLDTLAHAGEPVSGVVARRRPRAVVAHLDPHLVGRVADRHVRVAGAGVLERVGQTLLDDPVRGEVDRARQPAGLTLDVELHGQARSADLVQQRLDPVEAGLGRQVDPFAVLAQRAEQVAHLRERRAARLLDVLERLTVRCARVGEPVPDGAHLEHHHADGVGDDVVQLAGDPRALFGDSDAARGVPLALGLRRAALRRLGLLGSLAQREAREPADREQGREEDELAGGMAGVVVDDDRGTPLSAPLTLDAWVSAAKGDPSGLWFQSLLAQMAFPDEQVLGDVAAVGRVDAGDADTTFAPAADRGSIIGNPGSDLIWAGGGLADAWPAQPDEDEYDRVRTSDTETLLIGGSLDFATPPQNATKELLPHLPNGHQVVLPGFGHTNDFWNLQPAAGSRLVNAFLDSGKVDDSLYTARDVDFTPTTTLPAIAKILLGAMVGFAALAVLSLLWLALRVRKRGGVGRKASALLRSLYPLVLGLGGWFLGALTVLTIAPTVPLDDELLALLSIATPIGLGIYCAWSPSRPGAQGEDGGLRGRGRGRLRRRVARIPRDRGSRRRVHDDRGCGSRREPDPPRPRQRARPHGARNRHGDRAPGRH